MKFHTLMITGLTAFCLLASGCTSAEQKRLEADNQTLHDGLELFAQVRSASSGDTANAARVKLEERLGVSNKDLGVIGVRPAELDKITADKYFDDAQGQLKILRDPKTGPQAADKARAELYRTLKASGRNLGDLRITAKGVDALVAQANHRNEIRNSASQAAADHKSNKKRPSRRTPAL
jgi:hypothetical protein